MVDLSWMLEAVDCAMGAGEFPMMFEGKTLERDFIFEVSKGLESRLLGS